MPRLHNKSGYKIITDVIYYEEIRKFSPGVVIVNPQGMKTTRIATGPILYNSEQDADNASFDAGKILLAQHLSSRESLYFDQQ